MARKRGKWGPKCWHDLCNVLIVREHLISQRENVKKDTKTSQISGEDEQIGGVVNVETAESQMGYGHRSAEMCRL